MAELTKEKRKSKDDEGMQLQKQLNNKTREVEDLSKDLQASYVQHSKVQRMLELLREANIGSVEKVKGMASPLWWLHAEASRSWPCILLACETIQRLALMI